MVMIKIRPLTVQEQVQWTGTQQVLAARRARIERLTQQQQSLSEQLADLTQRLAEQEADAISAVQAMEPEAATVQFDGAEWAFSAEAAP